MKVVQGEAMTGTVLRLLTLVVALAALLGLSLHPMGSSAAEAAPALHAVHGGDPAGADLADMASACAVHCLAAAVPAAGTVPAVRRPLGPAALFGAPVRLAGLSPLPVGPPPKDLISS